MKITVQFESLAEFLKSMKLAPEVRMVINAPAPVEEQPDPAPVEEEPEKLPAEPVEAPEEAKITEDFRVEVRKTLAALNKLQAGNPAKQLIAETGYKRLTEVPLDLLPGLMQKAEEAMNHV